MDRCSCPPVVPRAVATLDFKLEPTSNLFKHGDRIRESVTGADREHFVWLPTDSAQPVDISLASSSGRSSRDPACCRRRLSVQRMRRRACVPVTPRRRITPPIRGLTSCRLHERSGPHSIPGEDARYGTPSLRASPIENTESRRPSCATPNTE
ncbi:CocE/NonD family hydrolase C-terminal non-catalytic domain-containing protein [Gemmatimonas sp.]|uniref:CocE/NonD family hydrolase C-terminal non-catalytic domain-containing protein n=1 Tax=Gemmatimonas sp. TaxID=1962908 RepID=UPI003F6E6FD7